MSHEVARARSQNDAGHGFDASAIQTTAFRRVIVVEIKASAIQTTAFRRVIVVEIKSEARRRRPGVVKHRQRRARR